MAKFQKAAAEIQISKNFRKTIQHQTNLGKLTKNLVLLASDDSCCI